MTHRVSTCIACVSTKTVSRIVFLFFILKRTIEWNRIEIKSGITFFK